MVESTPGDAKPDGIVVSTFLGKGNYACVYKGTYKGLPVAIKAVPNNTLSEHDRFSIQSFVHEAALMQCCKHKNVMRVMCTAVLDGTHFKRGLPWGQLYANGKAFAIVEELANGGALLSKVLKQMLSKGTTYNERQALDWAIDIASAVEHLHVRPFPIIHRDLKLENVLLVSDGPGKPETCKLADFGLCALLKDGKAIAASSVKLTDEQASNMSVAVERWIEACGAAEFDTVDLDANTGLLTATSFAENAFVSMLSTLREQASFQSQSVSRGTAGSEPGSSRVDDAPVVGPVAAGPGGGAAAAAAVSPSQVCVRVATDASAAAAPARESAASTALAGGSSMASMWGKIQQNVAPPQAPPAQHPSSGGAAGPAAGAHKPKAPLVHKSSITSALSRKLSKIISRRRAHESYALTGETGSLAYMAPEVTRNERYNEKADIFAVGVMLWELFARMSLVSMFSYEKDLQEHARRVANEGFRPAMPSFMPEALRALIAACWSQDAADRPSATEVLAALVKLREDGALDAMFPAGLLCCG